MLPLPVVVDCWDFATRVAGPVRYYRAVAVVLPPVRVLLLLEPEPFVAAGNAVAVAGIGKAVAAQAAVADTDTVAAVADNNYFVPMPADTGTASVPVAAWV